MLADGNNRLLSLVDVAALLGLYVVLLFSNAMRHPAAAVSTPLRGSLRVVWTLRLHLLALDLRAPYCLARLRRIASQLEYVLVTWPDPYWPTGEVHGVAIPGQSQLVLQLQELQATLPDTSCGDRRTLLLVQQQLLHLTLVLAG